MAELLKDLNVLSRGRYLQYVTRIKLLDDAIIRSNEPEEVLTYSYTAKGLGNRFIIPWRKTKGKLRRVAMEKMRGLNIATECHLKDGLCMKCPCCLLFGGTGDVSLAKVGYNLLSRILGDTFISAEQVGTINSYTANAVDEKKLMTGQALMTIVKVPAETEFVGVATLRDPTAEGAAILLDALQRLTRIGASNREWGRCRTSVEGYVLGDCESLSSYELGGKSPVAIHPVSALNLPTAEEGYHKMNDQCIVLLKQFEDQKKGAGRKGARTKATAEPRKESEE